MTRLPVLLLGLLASALVAAIVLQLDAGPGADPGLLAPVRAPVAAPPPAAAPARGDLAAAVLDRPLFTPGRRPPAAEAAARPGGPTEPPRLTGTMVSPAGRHAIFAGPDRPVVVAEGGRIGAFTVQRVAPDRVTLLGLGGPRVVTPSFDTGGAPPPAATATASPLPFSTLAAPSGLDIIRNAAQRAQAAASTQPGAVLPPAPPAILGTEPPVPTGAPPTR